jgi:hypothetical protein
MFAVPVGFAGLWVCKLLGGLVKEGAKAKRLAMHGLPARARVVGAAPTGLSVNDSPQLQLDLEIAMHDRAPYRAQTKVILPAFQLAALQPGAQVAVRVDPADPTSVALEMA